MKRVLRSMKNSWTGGEAAVIVESAEENLALSVRRGAPGAFERLMDRYESSLFTYAHGFLQNRQDAQEVVQDALVRAHRALTRQYDEARCASLALRPWLFRAVRNLCVNKRRPRGRALERPLEEYDDGRIGPFVPPRRGDFEQRQEADVLRATLASLPVEARELIVLRFMEEMSYAEMARTIGTTQAALRAKVFRALKMLREALEKKGVTHAV